MLRGGRLRRVGAQLSSEGRQGQSQYQATRRKSSWLASPSPAYARAPLILKVSLPFTARCITLRA